MTVGQGSWAWSRRNPLSGSKPCSTLRAHLPAHLLRMHQISGIAEKKGKISDARVFTITCRSNAGTKQATQICAPHCGCQPHGHGGPKGEATPTLEPRGPGGKSYACHRASGVQVAKLHLCRSRGVPGQNCTHKARIWCLLRSLFTWALRTG